MVVAVNFEKKKNSVYFSNSLCFYGPESQGYNLHYIFLQWHYFMATSYSTLCQQYPQPISFKTAPCGSAGVGRIVFRWQGERASRLFRSRKP